MTRTTVALAAALFLAELTILATMGRDQQAVFRSQADSVLLDVLATDRNGVIPKLAAADFEVRDNGEPQTLTLVSGDVAPLSVSLLLDTSGSLSMRELENLRRGASAVATSLRPDDELRLATFSQHVVLHGLVDTSAVMRIFGRLEPLGETALHDALTIGFRLSERQDSKRPVVIAFSDGEDTASWMTAKNVDDAAKQSWAAFFAATPRGAAAPIFSGLASLTGGTTVVLNAGFENLPESFLEILERVRQRYLLAFTPSSNTTGWHELDVRVKKPNARVVARRGYLRR